MSTAMRPVVTHATHLTRSSLSAATQAGTGALLCLTLPSTEERVFEGGSLRVRPKATPEEAAMTAKVAIQAAANAVRAALPDLPDLAVCAMPRRWTEEDAGGSGKEDVVVEATLILLHDPALAVVAVGGRVRAGGRAVSGKTDKAMWGALSALAGGGAVGDEDDAPGSPGLSPGAAEVRRWLVRVGRERAREDLCGMVR